MTEQPLILECKGLSKVYKRGRADLPVLRDVDLEVNAGEALCIVGSSGAGKSTLLHLLGALDRPTEGTVFFKGEDLEKKSDRALAQLRGRELGFVFQFHHLLGEFTALENILMPSRIAGVPRYEALQRADQLIETLGLTERTGHYPSELSGGEQQRVAIARSLINDPSVLLADEPTGNLDSENSQNIQDLFFELREKMNLTLIVVTHDLQLAQKFPRHLRLKDGAWVN